MSTVGASNEEFRLSNIQQQVENLKKMGEETGKRGMISSEDKIDGKSAIKKARIEDPLTGSTEEVFVKILIPPAAAGAIIGKGGEAMRKLHEDTGCRVKMSKNTDIYPGTNERVAIVHGPVNSAMVVLKHFMGKIRQNENSLDYEERSKEVKVVVPNTSAAMVIGKSGATIKEIRDKTSAGIQINPKQGSPEAQRSVERIITVSNPLQAKLEQAVEMVLGKVAGDPNHMAYPNMSYSGGGGPIHNDSANSEPISYPPFGRDGPHFGGRGPPHGHGPPMGPSNPPMSLFGGPGGGGYPGHMGGGGGMGDYMSGGGMGPPQGVGPGPMSGLPGMGGGPMQHQSHLNMQGKMFGQSDPYSGGAKPLGMGPASMMGQQQSGSLQQQSSAQPGGGGKFNPLEGLGNTEVLGFLDSLQSTLRSSGFNEQAVAEIMQAMQVLAKYNIMGLGLGLGVAAMATLRTDTAPATTQQTPTPQPPAPTTIPTPTPPARIQQMTQDARPFPPAVPASQESAVFMTSQTADSFFAPERKYQIPNGQGAMGTTQGGGNDLSAYFGTGVGGGDAGMAASQALAPGRQDHMGGGVMEGVRRGETGGGQTRWDSGETRETRGGPPQSQGTPGGAAGAYGTERSFAQSVMKLKQGGDPRRLEFDLPEQIVGAVMGPKATTLAEIQRYSGATVEIARKSEGSNPAYRTITIRAPDPESVRAGRFMVERAINEEQKRRQQQSQQQNSGPIY